MDPPQTVYPSRVMFVSFDVLPLLNAGANALGVLLGNYKWGYTDVWCNMTEAGGPEGCQAVILQLVIELEDGSDVVVVSRDDGSWSCRSGPVVWDHLFHGETYDARLELSNWSSPRLSTGNDDGWAETWGPVKKMDSIPAGASPPGTQAVGPLVPSHLPPLRIAANFSTQALKPVSGGRWVFDFGQNVAGFVTLSLPAGHGLPRGTHLRLEHGEISYGPGTPRESDAYNTFCHTASSETTQLRHEPCRPHQTYGWGHETADRYIGDFNCANMSNVYIVRGDGKPETYTPLFAAAGFRYVALSGLPTGVVPHEAWLTSRFVHTDVRAVGSLRLPKVAAEGSNSSGTADVLNRVHSIVVNAQLSNLWSVPTDCPQRERRGWMGDAQVSSSEAMLNLDMQAFYEKFLVDMRHSQLAGCQSRPRDGSYNKCSGITPDVAQGSLPDVVPFDGIGGWPGCPVWQVAYIVIARNYWTHYADATPLVQHYPGFVDLVDYFKRTLNQSSGLLETAGYGDWVCVDANGGCPRTPSGSVSAFYYVLALKYMSEIAEIIGETDEATKWASEYAAARAAYHSRYFDASVGGYSPVAGEPKGSQTSNAMALMLDAPSDAATRRMVQQALAENVAANDNHFTYGIVGAVVLHPALDDAGRGDLALATLLADDYPSYGHMVKEGMTTLCENWRCGFHDAGGGSQNHIMYGAFDAWMITALGGLSPTSNATSSGWEHFIAHPSPSAVLKLGSGAYSIDTRFGVASFDWKYDADAHTVLSHLSVPAGSFATVVHDAMLGGCRLTSVTEGESLVWGDGRDTTDASDAPATRVGSGQYAFKRRYVCGMQVS